MTFNYCGKFSLLKGRLTLAIAEGRARHEATLNGGYRQQGAWTVDVGTARPAIVGRIWEVGLAVLLNRPSLPTIGIVTAVDIDGEVEAKARSFEREGHDLPIRTNAKPDKPYALGWVWEDYSMIGVGWLFGDEAMERGRRDGLWNKDCEVWFIPPPYRPMRTLLNRWRK